MGLWGLAAAGIFIGYRPPPRPSKLDHLNLTQKIGQLNLISFSLLTAGLNLFLVGLNLGGGMYAWTNVRVLATLVIGLVILLVFSGYEWKGTETGILNHDLFRAGRTFAICIGLIFVEGIALFAYVIFYPIM